MECNSKYKSNKELNKALESMYDANMYSSITRVGGMLIISAVIEVIDYKGIEEKLEKDAIDLLFKSIFSPYLINGQFPFKMVEDAKKRIAIQIDEVKEDVKQQSILKALELINDGIRSLSMSGDGEVLNKISQENLYSFYKNLLEEADKDIFVVGNINPKEIDEYIFSKSEFNSITDRSIDVYLSEIKSKEISEQDEYKSSQTNYVQIYSLNGLSEYERDYVTSVFNAIWGSGSLESRLYKALRGKRGLCYNVSTYYQKYDKCLIVHTAIDPSSVNEVSKIIKKSITDIIKTGISDEELDSTKKLIKNSLDLIKDNQTKVVDNILFQSMGLIESEDTRKEKFDLVSSSDIRSLLKKLKLIISYRMGGK